MWHRWNVPEGPAPGRGLPEAGEVIHGARHHWRVLEVRPVESRRHPNAWRARVQPLGPHHLTPEALGAVRWRYAPPHEV